MLFELAIACRDEPEPWRKKEGDIISVQPYPFAWESPKHNFLIIYASFPNEREAFRLISPYYEDGIENPPPVDGFGFKLSLPAVVAKRKYKIPLDIIRDGWFPGLDMDRVRDITDPYQPFKTENSIGNRIILDTEIERVSMFFDKHRGSFRFKARKLVA